MTIDDPKNTIFPVIFVKKEKFEEVTDSLKSRGAELMTLSACKQDDGVILLHYYFKEAAGKTSMVEVKLNAGETVPSLYSKFQKADFIEREIYRFFGIKFLGHPNLGKEVS
jgi:NADH:ubiquinone oxidoreductase subunit C